MRWWLTCNNDSATLALLGWMSRDAGTSVGVWARHSKQVHTVLAPPSTYPSSVSAAMSTSALGDWRQWVAIRVTGSWAGRRLCGRVCVQPRDIPNGFLQPWDCWEPSQALQEGCRAAAMGEASCQPKYTFGLRAKKIGQHYLNNALYHPTKGFPGNPFQNPRWFPESFSCRHRCRLTIGRLLKIEHGIKFQLCQKQDDIL